MLRNIIFATLLFIAVLLINLKLYAQKPQIKKVMFLVHSEIVGGKGVYALYNALKEAKHEVKIVFAPPLHIDDANIDMNFAKKFDQNDCIYPCGTNPPYNKCDSIAYYKPDYVFVQSPYNVYKNSILDANFSLANVKKFAGKVAYIPYGPHIFHQATINDTKLPNLVDIVFADSESTREIYIDKFNFPADRVVTAGYQTYKDIRDYMASSQHNDRNHKNETILWMPRWFLSFKNKDLYEGGSTFLNYHYFFYDYASQNPNVNLIIRPHQGLFQSKWRSDFISQKDIDAIFTKFKSLPNVKITEPVTSSLFDDIIASDVVIADGTSALADAVVADKPIIYLSNGWNNEFNACRLSKEFKKYIYFAYDPIDIKEYIAHIRTSKYSPFEIKNINPFKTKIRYVKCKVMQGVSDTCDRDSFKRMLDPVENPATFIAEYLLLH